MKHKVHNLNKKANKSTLKQLKYSLYHSSNRRNNLGYKGIETDAQIKELKALDLNIIEMNFKIGDREQDINIKKHRYEQTMIECKNYMENSVKYKIYQEDEKAGENVQHILHGLETRLKN